MLYRTGSSRGSAAPSTGRPTSSRPRDLDAFMRRLLYGAEPMKTAGAGQANIPDAAKQCCRGRNH
jgi:hypothetical protein